MTKCTFQPVHKSVITLIEGAADALELDRIGRFICETEIRQGHEEIIAAWEAKERKMRLFPDTAIPESLQLQIRFVARPEQAKAA